MGSAYDADSEGEEESIMFKYDEIKNIVNIKKYFEIEPGGNWENKIILVEKEKPTKEILDELLNIRSKRKKPFFDDKTQLDLNCLWLSALIAADEILPNKGYLHLAENFFSMIEKKYINEKIYHSYSKDIVFIEDYAFLINAHNYLYEKLWILDIKTLLKNYHQR